MHELGMVIQIVKQMESYMLENDIPEIETLVLQIGALSSVYPKYIEDVYPIATEKSMLKNTNLEIEVTIGIGRCTSCDFAYSLIENKNTCPKCKGSGFTIISGKEFMIKEIRIRE